METILAVEDMTYARCGDRVTAALRVLPGVTKAEVDWRDGLAKVYHEMAISIHVLVNAIEGASAGTRHRYGARTVARAGAGVWVIS